MRHLPIVIRAEYRGEYRIELTFSDGRSGTVDLARWLEGPVFEPLKDPRIFRDFSVDGGTVVWQNGADFAPEALYAEVIRTAAA